MFKQKSAKPKPIIREPSRGPASWDNRQAPAPVRPVIRATNVSGTAPQVEPNTLVVAVDFGNITPSPSLPSPLLQLLTENCRYNIHRYVFNELPFLS